MHPRHLGNAKFKGSGEDDAAFENAESIGMAAKLLGCETDQLVTAIATLNIKAGLEWIKKPNSTAYAQNVKDALSKVLTRARTHTLTHSHTQTTPSVDVFM